MSEKHSAGGHISTKIIKQGELLAEALDKKAGCFYIVQSGRFIVNVDKEKIMELHQAEAPQCLGEEAVFGSITGHNPAVAVEDSQVIEIPLELAKVNLSKVHPLLQQILKGLAERLRTEINDLKMIKISRNALPCPPEFTAKVFGVIFHTARYVGKPASSGLQGELDEAWKNFIDYATQILEETPYRLEQALRILSKLGYAAMDKGKTTIRFKDLTQIETFFDFYQNYYFKSGYENLLRTNDKITAITQTFLKVSQPFNADRAGIVRMPFKPTIDAMKEILGSTFEADQLFRLEQKGLMVKRVTTQEGGILSFWRAEFEQMLLNWKVLREVELWNEKGYVKLDEDEPTEAKTKSKSPEDELAAKPEVKKRPPVSQWKPSMLSGKAPQIRTSKPLPGERLCPTCMSTLEKEQTICETCDTEN